MSNRGIQEGTCRICRELPERQLVELDLLLTTEADQLDEALLGDLEVPPEQLPAEFRRWGRIRKAQFWLEERGHSFRRQTLLAHFDRHLPAVAAYPSDTATALLTGRLSDGSPAPIAPEPLRTAIEYHAFFKLGMEAGHRALQLMIERMERTDPAPSNALLLQVASIGARLATAQASIVTRGMRFVLEDDSAIEGFIGDQPSVRFGSYRVREVDGERRPVYDEGPADRRHYNERARQEGGTELPAP